MLKTFEELQIFEHTLKVSIADSAPFKSFDISKFTLHHASIKFMSVIPVSVVNIVPNTSSFINVVYWSTKCKIFTNVKQFFSLHLQITYNKGYL